MSATSDSVYDRLAAGHDARAQLVHDTIHELQTNPDYQPYFAGYTPDSVADFIIEYAERKARYVFDGPEHARHFEKESTEVQEKAQARLWDIQQKKLFDLQCQWRAGTFQHPAIHVTDQFEYWGRHPERCPLLSPITPAELALYLEYLALPDCPEGDWSRRRKVPKWQDYHELRSVYYRDELDKLPSGTSVQAYDAEDPEEYDWDEDDEDDDWEENEKPTYPAWYRFHDLHGGLGHLRHLPNVRGNRQRHYTELALRQRWLNPKPAPEPPAEEASLATATSAAATPAEAVAPEPVAAPAPPLEPAVPAPAPAPYVPDNRPWYSFYDVDTFKMFVERFDPTPGLLELVDAQQRGMAERDSNESEDALFALLNLADSPLIIPIEADADDWRLALRQAELVLRRQQLIRALPGAYEAYCQREELGLTHIPPPPTEGWGEEPDNPWYLDHARKLLLDGREAAGEPRDFNY
jgi:hypothetical protein